MKCGCNVVVKVQDGKNVPGVLHDIRHDAGVAIVITVGGHMRVPLKDVEEVVDPNAPTTGPIGNWSQI
jgi:hypothetical protein